jgi:hypothetical protein
MFNSRRESESSEKGINFDGESGNATPYYNSGKATPYRNTELQRTEKGAYANTDFFYRAS